MYGTVSLFGGSEASQKEVPDSVPEVAGGVLFPRVCGLQLRGVWQSMDVVDKSLLPAPARFRDPFHIVCKAFSTTQC